MIYFDMSGKFNEMQSNGNFKLQINNTILWNLFKNLTQIKTRSKLDLIFRKHFNFRSITIKNYYENKQFYNVLYKIIIIDNRLDKYFCYKIYNLEIENLF